MQNHWRLTELICQMSVTKNNILEIKILDNYISTVENGYEQKTWHVSACCAAPISQILSYLRWNNLWGTRSVLCRSCCRNSGSVLSWLVSAWLHFTIYPGKFFGLFILPPPTVKHLKLITSIAKYGNYLFKQYILLCVSLTVHNNKAVGG